MTITGNKGEWSEFYTFVKLLDERRLFSADENLVINEELSYPVLRIFRDEHINGKRTYDIETDKNSIKIFDSEGLELAVVDASVLKKKVNEIFNEISGAKGRGAFSVISAEEPMKILQCASIKVANNKKSDIVLKIKDGARIEPEVGYSIKSMVGSASTLLNASGATNFIYRIDGLKEGIEKEVNSTRLFRDKLAVIKKNGGTLKFEKVSSEVFKNNLQLIDNIFPQVMAEFLLNYYEGKGNKLENLLEQLNQENIMPGFDVSMVNHRHKIKNFLVNVALGMVPNTEWDAYMKAHGGYIIVKRNGDLCCYQLYNRDKFQDYLYNNTKFDTPDPERHGFGKIYESDGQKYFNLNLQIRFIK